MTQNQAELSHTELSTLLSGENGAYVEGLFQDFLAGSRDLPGHWISTFERLVAGRGARPSAGNGAAGAAARTAESTPSAGSQPILERGISGIVNAYRSYGHLIANLDPLGEPAPMHAFLEPAEYGLRAQDLDAPLQGVQHAGCPVETPRALIEILRDSYCRNFAVEFMHLSDKQRRDWLIERMEPIRNRPALSREAGRQILEQVVAADAFERFLQKRFLGQKRFSLEGGESLIPMLDVLLEGAAELGAAEIVIAMAHRGRLNVMAHTMGMPYGALMAEFQVSLAPRDAQGSGDVKYHRGYSADRTTLSGRKLHVSLCPNPSHLEAINPVAEGMTRAKQNHSGDTERTRVIPLQIHGDAAFCGQGLVPETLWLSELENYWTGGTIHVIVNNQIGFTTNPAQFRFTRYPSDIAKAIQAPIFHVNADDPEACAHAARLAIEFRQCFREDVIIDLVCYRRRGHNEGDDPSFTQPLRQRQIESHPTVAQLYAERLHREGRLDPSTITETEANRLAALEKGLAKSTEPQQLAGSEGYRGLWERFGNGHAVEQRPTAIPRETIQQFAAQLQRFPDGFHPHPKLVRLFDQRAAAIRAGRDIDWGTAEALAFASLLAEGITIRLTGQDVERGTFGHRHAVAHDVKTGDRWIWLDELASADARLIIANSMLSEAAVLGFEYGYSTVDPTRLTVWEAQFGDFANSAQVIIDQFIASAETKWNRSSGLVMLLPHGYEGQGPEHSSARLERFLQLCAEDNLRVCNLTTAGQYFHALRRQICENRRTPLVLMSPKSLLRHPGAASNLDAFERGRFEEILDDPRRAAGGLHEQPLRRVLLCSGKVFYTLLEAAREHGFDDVAIVRVEQIHPFPFSALREMLGQYDLRDFVWVQEEPWNMGAWSFVQDRIRSVLPKGGRLRYAGRHEAASPAAGSYRIHQEQEVEFVREAFARRARRRR
ncbi:MAG: 2-oxoglutarate dehydrogenase E1 component [Myxococcota bacterium]|nr:2-oxoglutarate dehydrogenase E1 component [Myxococcota bacterium]